MEEEASSSIGCEVAEQTNQHSKEQMESAECSSVATNSNCDDVVKFTLGQPEGEEQMEEDLKLTVQKLRRDLDNAKSEVAVADYLKESLAQTERQKESLQEEMATLQALLLEATQGQEQESQLMKMRKRAKALESENQDLKIQLRMLEGRRNSVRGGTPRSPLSSSSSLAGGMDKESLLGSAAVISDRTKNMVRKMKSTVVQSFPAGSGLPEEEMKKQQAALPEEAAMKTLIEPLEEQIVALKGKLRETDSLLQIYEKRQGEALVEMARVSGWLEGEDTTKLNTKLAQAARQPQSEVEGQLYQAILAARIGMLSQDLEAATSQVMSLTTSLDTVNGELTAVKMNAAQLVSGILQSVNQETRQSLLATYKTQIENLQNSECPGGDGSSSTSKLIVSSEEWQRMKTTLENVPDSTSLVGNDAGQVSSKLEADLISANKEKEALVKEKEALIKEREHLQKNCTNYKQDLSKEAEFRKEMEATWNTRGAEYRTHVESLQARLRVDEEKIEKISVAFLKLKEEGKIQLSKLTADRERIIQEIKRVQDENDRLVGKHSQLAETMNNEVINLPDNTEDMQLLLLQYREDLITAKVGKERAEEKLVSDVTLMKQQLAGEQHARTNIQHQYSVQLKELEEKMRSLEPAHLQLQAETLKRRDLQEKLSQVQNSQNVAMIENTKHMEALRNEKESAEAQISQLKSKIVSLQTDLDNSVAVQNDFVRLSQNLQMELEKIRQSEKEVRWQHEDDITECNGCRSNLHKKKKDNCRHCGRIFCNDCLQKKVSSGTSGRQVCVCDVCHTLLVQNSAPYFASEAPSQI